MKEKNEQFYLDVNRLNDAGSARCMFKSMKLSDDELQRLMEKFVYLKEMVVNRRISIGWLIDQQFETIGDAGERKADFLLSMEAQQMM